MTQRDLFGNKSSINHEALRLQENNRRIGLALRTYRPGSQKHRIINWFIRNRGRWFNRSELTTVFGLQGSSHFIGINYDRRLRELLQEGVLDSETDPSQQNQTHRWRMP